MKIELTDIEFQAIRRLYDYRPDDCDGECGTCRFHMHDNPADIPVNREPNEYCAIGEVGTFIAQVVEIQERLFTIEEGKRP